MMMCPPFFCLVMLLLSLSFKLQKCAKPSPNYIYVVLSCDCCLSLYMLSCLVFSCVMLSFCFVFDFQPPLPHVSHKRRSYAHWNLWTKRGILLTNILLTIKYNIILPVHIILFLFKLNHTSNRLRNAY